jgi:hypothetical protein
VRRQIRPRVFQHRPYKILRAFADHAFHGRGVKLMAHFARRVQVGQHGVHGGHKVAQRVHQRAVQVHRGGIEIFRVQIKRVHAKQP